MVNVILMVQLILISLWVDLNWLMAELDLKKILFKKQLIYIDNGEICVHLIIIKSISLKYQICFIRKIIDFLCIIFFLSNHILFMCTF